MRTWRLLVGIGREVWTFVVAADDHAEAWGLVLQELPLPDRGVASLEELEATGEPLGEGLSRVLHAWKSAPLTTGSSGTASAVA